MTLLGSGLIAAQGAAALTAGQLARHSGYFSAFLLTCASGAVAVLSAFVLVRPETISPYRAAHVPKDEAPEFAADTCR
ncbi:hypothetical protein ACFWRV_16645 [Streptomyces sp. NPDC058576]|uniref:hypothetical protein n=1 Tax=Streptomyces sp. NPDC058576 TaxID=3346547 RepID=UPI0036497F15